jgi:hypothetical protein
MFSEYVLPLVGNYRFRYPDSWRGLTSVFGSCLSFMSDRLCGLVARVPGYRYRGPEFDSRRYQIFWEVLGLERGILSLVSTVEELLIRKSSGFGLERREYGRRDLSSWPHDTLYPQILALTSLTRGGSSVGIFRSQTEATEFISLFLYFSLSSIAPVYYSFSSDPLSWWFDLKDTTTCIIYVLSVFPS